MNAGGAAQASVAVEALASVGKNKKPHGGGKPAGLERGLNKGSAQFRELLAARAAHGASGSGLKSAAAAAARVQAQEAAGLKDLLALLLARAHVESDSASAASRGSTEHARDPREIKDSKKKNPAAGLALLVGAESASPAIAHAATPAHKGADKEKKDAAPEPAKAPALDAKLAAHKSEPLIRILDLRRHHNESADSSARRTDPAPSQDRDLSAAPISRPASREIPLDSVPRPAVSSSPAQTPLERLRDMAGSELVRASQLVLKDGGGEIRLVLKPESLGSVRVRMNVVDNSIEGRIIVDSSAVKHVLEGSVDALRRALTAEGFQMGSLQVSVGGQDAQSDPRREQDQAPAEVRRIAAQGFERSVPGAEDVSLGDLFVNLFV